jgi:hypothetical protein
MVTVINYEKRTNAKGIDFFVLQLQGEVEMIRAVDSGKFYAHARKATITTTLDELSCRGLIGKQFPGEIKKVECEEYSYTIPGSTDTITLTHSYQYVAENATMEETILEKAVA